MKQVTWTITENTPLTPDTYRLRLAGDTEAITAPRSVRKPDSPASTCAAPSPSATGSPVPPPLSIRCWATARRP